MTDAVQLVTFAIVLITRDRPGFAVESLEWIACAGKKLASCECLGIVVVDDSIDEQARTRLQVAVEETAVRCPVIHLSARDQLSLMTSCFGDAWRIFARPLGDPDVNIGSSRNTGMAYWLMRGRRPDMLVFFDDDLIPTTVAQGWLESMILLADQVHGIVGMRLGGMIDESTVKRLVRGLRGNGESSPRKHSHPVSGGCVAIARGICERFPFSFFYNEDWLLFLEAEAAGYEVIRLDRVALAQHNSSPIVSRERLEREALGEIAFRVLQKMPATHNCLDSLAADSDAWTTERSTYRSEIDAASKLCTRCGMNDEARVLRELSGVLQGLEMEDGLRANHRIRRQLWRQRFGSSQR